MPKKPDKNKKIKLPEKHQTMLQKLVLIYDQPEERVIEILIEEKSHLYNFIESRGI
jgi:hypothetical protein